MVDIDTPLKVRMVDKTLDIQHVFSVSYQSPEGDKVRDCRLCMYVFVQL